MKNYIPGLFCLLSLINNSSSAQVLDSTKDQTPSTYEMYKLKAQTNKTLAWIMLGSGFALAAGGMSTNISSGWGVEDKNKGLGVATFGMVSMLSSIPFFIAGGKNKRKANVALKQESAMLILRKVPDLKYPALAFRYCF